MQTNFRKPDLATLVRGGARQPAAVSVSPRRGPACDQAIRNVLEATAKIPGFTAVYVTRSGKHAVIVTPSDAAHRVVAIIKLRSDQRKGISFDLNNNCIKIVTPIDDPLFACNALANFLGNSARTNGGIRRGDENTGAQVDRLLLRRPASL